MSRFDTMPSSFSPSLPCSVMGKLEKPYSALILRQSATVCSGESTVGSRITPLRYIFTSWTSCACSSIVQLLCTTPRPPCCAMAIAIWCSVTVSMQELTKGTFSLMLRLKWLDRSTLSVGKLMKPRGGETSVMKKGKEKRAQESKSDIMDSRRLKSIMQHHRTHRRSNLPGMKIRSS